MIKEREAVAPVRRSAKSSTTTNPVETANQEAPVWAELRARMAEVREHAANFQYSESDSIEASIEDYRADDFDVIASHHTVAMWDR